MVCTGAAVGSTVGSAVGCVVGSGVGCAVAVVSGVTDSVWTVDGTEV